MKLLLFILLIIHSYAFFDYNQNHTLYCRRYTNYTIYQKWQTLYLHTIDRYSFLSICPGIFILQLCILLAFFLFKELRQRPGDLFIGLIISMMVNNIHLFITAIYYTVHSQNGQYPGDTFPSFCTVNGFVSIISEVVQLFYSIALCLHIVSSLRTNLKYKRIKSIYQHSIFVILGIVIAYICYHFNLLGLNIYGTCSFIITSFIFPIINSIASLIFVIIGYFSLNYFTKHMPQTYGLRQKKYKQIQRFSLYIFGVSVISIISSIFTFVIIQNCKRSSPNPNINVLVTFENQLKLVQFCFLNYVIINSELMLNKMKKMYRKIFSKSQINSDLTDLYIQQSIQNQQEMIQMINSQQMQYFSVMDTLRISQIGSIVFGVQFFQLQLQNLIIENIKSSYFTECVSTKINAETLNQYNIFIKNCPLMNILQAEVTEYAPKIFKHLLQKDDLKKVYQSFQLNSNYQGMFNMLQGQGGKSGQFFFFTVDNRYMLKTVNQNQMNILLSYLPVFYEYYLNNSQSLLAKIYGLYTFRGKEIQRTFHVILMKNIIGCNRQNVQRVFDMKGSSYDREVLVANKIYNYQQLRSITLKDTDFKKLQGRINIEKDLAIELKKNLSRDSQFLKSLNLIDYSLLIIKVKWNRQKKCQQPISKLQLKRLRSTHGYKLSNFGKQALKKVNQTESQNENELDPQLLTFWNKLQRIPSTFQPNIYYHIGIIDYIQKWDIQKKSEKWWKTLFGAKDVSAQSPQVYHSRFSEFIDSIIEEEMQL